ncbi:uncharacterized protein N7496_002198 [Penicillium cataractarum]|uniref:Exonuclease domain-containing protein n=1 Tax=Penicillium cataractarum TaxID=2100454 RepID=A0A9W9SKU0_9EURO|nr:uncharacterized protein N7496_002198 [Penicillium cataractarum]KAJ5379770.1 hypothetical protein N7496_002198 [Penicillium cataractarum]
MVRSTAQLTPIRFTGQEWADLNGLVLSRSQMIEHGLRVENFNTQELAQLRRCLLCRHRIKRRKVLFDGNGLEIDSDESANAQSAPNHTNIITQKTAFNLQMAEDLEWALLVRQRLVFLEDADQGTTEGTKKASKKEDSVELPKSVSSYYLRPFYVLPDLECIFDYSKFTILTADDPIWHRLGPDGKLLHYRSRIQLSIETGEVSYYSVKVTEGEFQEYLRNHQYRQEDVTKKGRCQSHPGDFSKGFTCCNQGVFSKGCSEFPHHVYNQTPGQLWKDFHLHETPARCNTPRRCIVLDCEMGVANTGEPELVRITAIDYFSGETLMDSLVFPQVKMWHLNKRFSGVDWPMLHKARKAGRIINGRDAARRQLWKFVGRDTIVIVHGGHNDFLCLRWIHCKVIDTMDCESRLAEPAKSPGLKNLTKAHLGREIQKGRGGHDSLEDAQATRDLAVWYVQNLPASAKVQAQS